MKEYRNINHKETNAIAVSVYRESDNSLIGHYQTFTKAIAHVNYGIIPTEKATRYIKNRKRNGKPRTLKAKSLGNIKVYFAPCKEEIVIKKSFRTPSPIAAIKTKKEQEQKKEKYKLLNKKRQETVNEKRKFWIKKEI